MAWRFRKSIKLGKFVKLNIGKKGLGLSTGIKGARVGLNSRGTYTSVAIPGTGISNMTYHGKNSKQSSSIVLLKRKPMDIKCTNCEYQGKPKTAGGMILLVSFLLFVLGLFTFPFGLLLWIIIPFLNKQRCPECGWKNVRKIKKEETIPTTHTNDTSDQIQKLYDLKEKGILTEEEFQRKKQKILES